MTVVPARGGYVAAMVAVAVAVVVLSAPLLERRDVAVWRRTPTTPATTLPAIRGALLSLAL